jgi:hypothetical protein
MKTSYHIKRNTDFFKKGMVVCLEDLKVSYTLDGIGKLLGSGKIELVSADFTPLPKKPTEIRKFKYRIRKFDKFLN